MSKIPIYKKIRDVYIKVGEADEQNFDWLKDEPDMKIVVVYIDELEDEYSVEERRIYEYHAEL